jgi:5-methylcytosine-specific restriction endonuclease McrA
MTDKHSSKRCNKCGEEKPFSGFFSDPRRKDGKRATCKACFPRTGGKPTPEQRAQARRRRGETTAEYVPAAIRLAQAEIRRAEKARAAEERITAAKAIRESLHDAHVQVFRSASVKWARRYNEDPKFAIKQRLRSQLRKKAKLFPKLDGLMRDAIRRGGRSGKVEMVCGYAIADLMRHLESQFVSGMSWDAFLTGDIHIDHIVPQAAFDLSDIEETRKCWALENLQPLWAQDNLRKGATMPGAHCGSL